MAARSPLRALARIAIVAAALCAMAGLGPACTWSAM